MPLNLCPAASGTRSDKRRSTFTRDVTDSVVCCCQGNGSKLQESCASSCWRQLPKGIYTCTYIHIYVFFRLHIYIYKCIYTQAINSMRAYLGANKTRHEPCVPTVILLGTAISPLPNLCTSYSAKMHLNTQSRVAGGM